MTTPRPALRLDVIALVAVVVFAALYLGALVLGLLVAVPFGALGLIPVAVGLGLLVAVVRQRLTNAEDQHYSRNVDE